MALDNVNGTTYSSALLITDTYQLPNGSNDSLPPFTLVNGFPVSAALEIRSTLGGFLGPRMTTVQRDALNAAPGMQIFNLTTSTYDFCVSLSPTVWVSFSGSDVVGPAVSVINDIVVFGNTTGNLLKESNVQLIYSSPNSNLFEGAASGDAGATGQFNTSFGISVLNGITTGSNNFAAGVEVLNVMQTGSENYGIGSAVLNSSNNATRNIGIGFSVMSNLSDVTDMFDNICLGNRTLGDVTSATTTIAIGNNICSSGDSVADCVFIGFNVASNFAGAFTELTGIGAYALEDVQSTAVRVTALGWSSLRGLTTASRCTAAGYLSLPLITASATGSDASAFGANSFENATTALQSSAFGSGSGSTQTQYTGCLFLGYNADASNNNLTNANAIGAGASVAVSNAMVLGAAGTHVGINTSSPTAAHLTNAGSEAVNAVSVINASFPYVALGTDSVILCYPTGPQTVTIPDASAANYGRKFVVVNRSGGGLDRITVSTTTNQPIQSSNVLNFQSSKTFIAVPAANDGVTNAPGYVCINESQGV